MSNVTYTPVKGVNGVERSEGLVFVLVAIIAILVIVVIRCLQQLGSFFGEDGSLRIDFRKIGRWLRDVPVVQIEQIPGYDRI